MLAVSLNFTIIDGKGKTSTTKIRVPTGFTPAQYVEAAEGFAQLMLNMSEGAITDISVSLPVNLSGATLRSVPLAIADIAKKALFTVASSVTNLFARFNIPTFDEQYTVPASDDLDMVDANVAAYVAVIEDGVNVSGTFIQPCDLRGNDLASVREAREVFRKFN